MSNDSQKALADIAIPQSAWCGGSEATGNEGRVAWRITAVESDGDDKSVALTLKGYPSDSVRSMLRLPRKLPDSAKMTPAPAPPPAAA